MSNRRTDDLDSRTPFAKTSAVTGTIRSRTDTFLKFRRQTRGLSSRRPLPGLQPQSDGSETARLMASALGTSTSDAEAGLAGVAAALPPAYVEFKDEVRFDMLGIKEKMNELKSLHGKASLSRFDDAKDDEVAVEVVTQQITKMFRKCEARLQKFAGGAEGHRDSTNEADEKVRKNVQRTLAVELQRLSVQFRKQQKEYLNQLRTRDGNKSAAAALNILDATPSAHDSYDPGFSDMQALKADTLNSIIQERDNEVVKILKSIHELAQIMKDLSVLVIDQGTILDRIDYNLEQTGARVEEGVQQLKKAERQQRQGVAAMCVSWLLIAIVVMFLLLIFKIILF